MIDLFIVFTSHHYHHQNISQLKLNTLKQVGLDIKKYLQDYKKLRANIFERSFKFRLQRC